MTIHKVVDDSMSGTYVMEVGSVETDISSHTQWDEMSQNQYKHTGLLIYLMIVLKNLRP